MRVAASVAVTVLVSAALAGCQFVTPQQTMRSYTPSDGVNGSVGALSVRNAFVLDGADDAASVIGVLANNANTAQSVTLQWTSTSGTETQQLQVPAGGLLSMSTQPVKLNTSVPSESAAVLLSDVNATPGGLFNVVFTTSAKSRSFQLPVLTGSFSQYATLAPTPTPTPTKTKRSTPVPGITNGVSPTPTPEGTTRSPQATPAAG